MSLFSTLLLLAGSVAPAQDTLLLSGLRQPVEIITDRWGIAHIYGETEEDLFFGQGFNAARDRLFQFEVWRRQTNGTVAEMLGPREVERDIGTRLFRFRGDLEQELNYYHPRGSSIIRSFVAGVNAYIAETERDPSLLPIEFELLGIRPGRWTPETVISRHQGLLGNIGQELANGRALNFVEPDRLIALRRFAPGVPDVTLDPSIDPAQLLEDILGVYNAFRRPVQFRPEDVVERYRGDATANQRLSDAANAMATSLADMAPEDIGSNNWVVSGDWTESGFPMMANDPHRAQSAPSLRYWVHLVGPGWNVIGGGEPEIPGVSIGHNDYGAWGLTVFATDAEDLYVYDTNPANREQYRYRGNWESMTVIEESVPVKGQSPVTARLKYTRHGPVVYEDLARGKAYAVRAGWMEIGGAPYLASLRMDQARSWEEFREACNYSHIPGENMVWADRDGTIGWQAVGIAPIRRNWSGLVPVPGDGRYEWDGYLPIKAKPNVVNPRRGFFGTANNNLIPPDYPYRDAVGWSWSSPYRWTRLTEVLGSGRRHSMMDMMQLQTDVLSMPARTLTPLLSTLRHGDRRVEDARRRLLEWDHRLHAQSVAAGIYVAWERRLLAAMRDSLVPEAASPYLGIRMEHVVDQLLAPTGMFGTDPIAGRDAFVLEALEDAVTALSRALGSDAGDWRLGQEEYKHALIRHPLSRAVSDAMRARLDVGPAPRGGNSFTVNNTGGGNNQTSGASFRIIVDTGDWDRTVGSNTPGQSGNPDDPHYRNLFSLWAEDRFFPAFYSRDKIESVADRVTVLAPRR